MLFIDANNGMDDYAAIRGVTAQEIRDTKLACLESDANDDLKKAVTKNHSKALFRMFLSGGNILPKIGKELICKTRY